MRGSYSHLEYGQPWHSYLRQVIKMKKIDLQGAILPGIGTLIVGLTGWLMTTTLGVD